MKKVGKTGVLSKTPENVLFGAGTIHKNLKFTDNSWNFEESIIGATSGGSKVTITPELKDIEADGALVLVKGLKVKTGEKATMEVNFLEVTKDVIVSSLLGQIGTSEDKLYDLIESKPDIAEGDYFENIAFVGQTLKGKYVIAILENALCTNGFETEGKNKENAVLKCTFECHADTNSDLDKLPWKIYYPKITA